MKQRSINQIKYIILHCSDNKNGTYHDIDGVNKWHKARGFRRSLTSGEKALTDHHHVGYNYVIPVSGQCQIGRMLWEIPAHARGYNTRSIGICLMGRDKFTVKQWRTLAALISELKFFKPDLKIIAHHRVNTYKTCPNFDVARYVRNDLNPEGKNILTYNDRK